jgi:putative ABC transport system ATP-binding protein
MGLLRALTSGESERASAGAVVGAETEATRRFAEALAFVGLGLEGRLGARVAQLSGGQRQVLALAMAVLNPPRVLLLDEHCAALDPRTARDRR